MLRLDLVRTEYERARMHGKSTINLGTAVYFQLSIPQMKTYLHVCADGCLYSVETADYLYSNGIRLSGVVKKEIVRMLMRWFENREMNGREYH